MPIAQLTRLHLHGSAVRCTTEWRPKGSVAIANAEREERKKDTHTDSHNVEKANFIEFDSCLLWVNPHC